MHKLQCLCINEAHDADCDADCDADVDVGTDSAVGVAAGVDVAAGFAFLLYLESSFSFFALHHLK